jgi:hypothetical protein
VISGRSPIFPCAYDELRHRWVHSWHLMSNRDKAGGNGVENLPALLNRKRESMFGASSCAALQNWVVAQFEF